MSILAVIGGISGIVALAWKLGEFVSSKTKNTWDDSLFQHPELRDALVELLEKLLNKTPPPTPIKTLL